MGVPHSICAAAAAVSIVALIVWGATSCSQQDSALREACIKGGASVVRDGQSFHCLRISGPTGER